MYEKFAPTNFEQANCFIKGRPVSDEEKRVTDDAEIKGANAWTDGNQVITVWKTKSLLARISFLINGKINLIVMGPRMLPVAMSIGKIFHRK
ncbi:MAG: hypothetical protein EPGJADBJ_04447 [Saprospiraceae bacterium]|nr:hypothetical protein [Saprospiraceae bacterium]